MKEIKLTQGKIAIVDDMDYEYLSQFKWHAKKHGLRSEIWYAARTTSRKLGNQKTILMHKEILGITGREFEIDHIDHNGLNNCRINLRRCTHRQNMANCVASKTGSSKYKGVSIHSTTKKFVVHIYVSGKLKYLGSFDNEIEAAKCYDENSIANYGEFAYINFKQT